MLETITTMFILGGLAIIIGMLGIMILPKRDDGNVSRTPSVIYIVGIIIVVASTIGVLFVP